MLVASGAAGAGTMYKWVDRDGTIHYSSQPVPGATEVHIDSAPPVGASVTDAARKVATESAAPAAAEPFKYTGCAISRPSSDEVLPNAFSVSTAWQIDPALRPGDRVTVALDGKLLPGVSPTATSFTITPIDRGTHTLVVSILDANGRGVCQSPGITFHVQQTSLLAPNRRPAKKPRS
jgi:hypothetical protein